MSVAMNDMIREIGTNRNSQQDLNFGLTKRNSELQ